MESNTRFMVNYVNLCAHTHTNYSWPIKMAYMKFLGKLEAKGLPSALRQMPVSRRFNGCHTLEVQVYVGHNLSIIGGNQKAT